MESTAEISCFLFCVLCALILCFYFSFGYGGLRLAYAGKSRDFEYHAQDTVAGVGDDGGGG
eukprot:1379214-Amorphochlora_amoeboformis.AAC.2